MIIKYFAWHNLILLITTLCFSTGCVVTRRQLDKTLDQRFEEQGTALREQLTAYSNALETKLQEQRRQFDKAVTELDARTQERLTVIAAELKNLRGQVMLSKAQVDATVQKLETLDVQGQQALQSVKEFLESKSRALSNQKKAIDDLLLQMGRDE